MKSRYLFTFMLIATILTGCQKEEVINMEPKVTEKSVEVGSSTATFAWTVDWLGKFASVVEVSENEDMSDSQTFGSEVETTDHSFTATATVLKDATEYYYRYLVWNKNYVDKKFKTEVKSFTTKSGVPKVKTTEVTDVTRTTATIICEVTDESGASVTERGVCWGSTQNSTTSGNHLSNGNGMGIYSVAITGLETGKTYYARAYAKNVNGTAYGKELSFITGDAVKPTVTTADVSNIDWRTATGGGTVTDDGDATVTERGICWSTSHDPSVSGSHASSGTGTGNYTVNMTGLTAGTTYYVRAYAKNQAGTSYGNEVSFTSKAPELPTLTTSTVTDISYTTAKGGGKVTSDGGTEVTERGICWSTSHNPEITDSHASIGTGTGAYTVNMSGLTEGTTYYVRAYAENSKGMSYGEEKSFTTKAITKPTVTTVSVTNITYTSATCGGEVTDDGGAAVTERGVCWGTSHNPEVTDDHVSNGTGTGSFTVNITGLTDGKTYYVRAYAKNSKGTSYGEEKSFTTKVITKPTVTTASVTNISYVSATCGGEVTDDCGAAVTERGICWSTSQNPEITDSHASSGTGTGSFTVNITGLVEGTTYYVRAYAKNSKGTSYGNEQAFCPHGPGSLNGKFSVSSSKQVFFSQGNLQYNGSSNTWKFADNQWDVIGTSQGTSSQSTNRDLFGWGTSGWNCGNTYYRPYDTDMSDGSGSQYGPLGSNDLTGDYANSDWGVYNAISNGGNQAGLWRTLTKDEWVYLFNTRQGSWLNGVASARYARAKVNDMAGVILFPDSYTHPGGVSEPSNINQPDASSASNSYSGDDWNKMEQAGCVFLPAAGGRIGTSVGYVGSKGGYWSASYRDSDHAYGVHLYSGLNPGNPSVDDYRSHGRSVRLVRSAQ